MKKPSFFCNILANIITSLLFFVSLNLYSQTNPLTQELPFSSDFGTTTFTTLPTGFVCWTTSVASGTQAGAENSIINGDATLTASTTEETNGGCYGYATGGNGRLYIQHSNNTLSPFNATNQLAAAVNTEGYAGLPFLLI